MEPEKNGYNTQTMAFLIITLTLSFIAIIYLNSHIKWLANQLKEAESAYKAMAKAYGKMKNDLKPELLPDGTFISYKGLNDPDAE
jgi:hypothetical protein